jgi:antitoxin component HigA of HigAB toxin-antitoxin module
VSDVSEKLMAICCVDELKVEGQSFSFSLDINGTRHLTAGHIRRLSAHFALPAEYLL